jgi:hypothetical protein
MQNALTPEQVTALQEWIGTAGEFISEQAPLVVQEIITWGYIYYTWMLVMWICFAAASFGGGWGIGRLIKKDDPFNESGMLIGCILGFISLICVGYCANSLLYIHFAPRLYILSALRDFVPL